MRDAGDDFGATSPRPAAVQSNNRPTQSVARRMVKYIEENIRKRYAGRKDDDEK